MNPLPAKGFAVPSAPASLKRNTAWMLLGRGGQLVSQAAYFILLARSLGVREYGVFVGAMALPALLAPFSAIGTNNLLVRDVARDRRQFAAAWGRCLITSVVVGTVFSLLLSGVSQALLSAAIPALMLLQLALAELVFARMLEAASMAFQAVEKLQYSAAFGLLLSFLRLFAAAGLMLSVTRPNAMKWAHLYLLSTALAALIAVGIVCWRLELPRWAFVSDYKSLRDGLYFSFGVSAQSVYNDIDKTMLLNLANNTAAGQYGAAYRMIDASCAPLSALLAASFARFFQRGMDGVRACVRFALPLMRTAVVGALLIVAGLIVFAPLMRVLAGKEFGDSIWVLRWLAPLVLLRSVHYFAANILTGCGYQGIRTGIQIVIAALNIILNLQLLPRYSLSGAIFTSLVSDTALAVSLWLAVAWFSRRSIKHKQKIHDYAEA